jgi:hypothetical protein
MKKSIPNFENLYEIDETGIVYSLQRTVNTKGNGIRIVPAKELKTFKDKNGCEKVQLFKSNKKYILSVNALKKQLFGE